MITTYWPHSSTVLGKRYLLKMLLSDLQRVYLSLLTKKCMLQELSVIW